MIREACGPGRCPLLDPSPGQWNVMGVLFVSRVIGEHKRAAGPVREAQRGPTQKKGVMGVEEIEVEPMDEPGNGRRERNREGELWIGERGDGAVADHPPGGRVGRRKLRCKDKDFVPSRLQSGAECLDGGGNAADPGRVIIREKPDSHSRERMVTSYTCQSPRA